MALGHIYLPSSEGQVRAVRAGWGVGVVPELLARSALAQGELVNLAPAFSLPIALYWHCWNLQSALLDALTGALTQHSAQVLDAA